MAGGYSVPDLDAIEQLVTRIQAAERNIRELAMPTGSEIADALATLQDLVAGLLTQVNGVFSGYVSAGTSISAGTTITSGGDQTTSGFFYSPNAYNYDITYTRHQMWMGNDGRIAWASSSRAKKTNIRDAEIDPLAVLAISVRAYNYRAEIAKRDDPKSLEYVGPNYHVADELGTIAEELHDLGLWQVVEYEDHKKPIGVHDHLLGHLAIRAVQYVWEQHQDLASEVAGLKKTLDALTKRLDSQGL